MKKISCLLVAAFAVCSVAWAGTGIENDPYTIAEAIALSESATEFWAQGYIVGGRYDDFDAPWTGDYGISLADTDSESDVNNCLQVRLESDARADWGLASSPDKFQTLIKFQGFRDAYGGFPSFEGVTLAKISEVSLADQPPVLASVGNKSVIWSNTLTFSVSASDTLDGDDITLSATDLPSGATFATVTNAGTASSTFTWADAGPMGVYTTTFWAVDNDGSSSETITINVGDGSSPADIAWQGFENTAADTWAITVGDGSAASESGSTDTPANQRIRTDTTSWQPGMTDDTVVELELATVDVSSYSDVVIELHMSATCTNFSDGYGMYPTDAVTLSVALDGGAYNADLVIAGNAETGDGIEGVLWPMDATGIAATTAGVSRTMAPASGGIVDDGLATARIYIPAGTTSVKLKASVAQEYYGYFWNIDDIALNGVNDGGASDLPPTIAISPSGTSKSVAVDSEMTFTVTGTEIPNDAADTMTLRATGLPSGATFAEVSGTSVLSNTFSWTPTAVGSSVVSFFVEDKDGTNQIDVTVEAYEQTAGGTYYGIFAGLNQYSSSYIGSSSWLDGCVPDAMHVFTNATERGGWVDNPTVSVLTDSAGTKSAIRAAIANYASLAVAGDTFLYFHSSHGGNDDFPYSTSVYLCTYDADYQDTDLAADLSAFAAGVKVVIMVDACHSGGLFKSALKNERVSKADAVTWDLAARVTELMDETRATRKASGMKGLDKLISSSEIGWVTAANHDEYSWDDTDGGAFTTAVIDGWDDGTCDNATYGNQDGYASFYELWNYAKDIAIGYPGEVDPNDGTTYETTPQAFNTSVLQSTIAGWVGAVAPVTSNQPPSIALNPAGSSKTVTFDEELTFTVTATDMDGAAVSLTVSNLPSGATAADDSGTGTASTTFTWTPLEAQVGSHSVDFYATDVDGTTSVTVSITVGDGSATTDLLISEYFESGGDKYIEVFNGTGASVDLSGYSLRLYSNGASTPGSDVTLSGSLADGAVIVYQNSGSSLYTGTTENNAAVNFNGNDAVALAKASSNIDVVGTIGDATAFGEDMTLVRKSSVFEGNTTFTLTEWDEYPEDTIEYLGSHTFGGGETPVTPDPEPISALVSPTNGMLSLEIPTQTGTTYALECSSNLLAVPPVWIQVDSAAGTGGNVVLEDADPSEAKGYYRIVKP
jgi:Lamin Tail Domain/Domain of unknown function (DUF6359)